MGRAEFCYFPSDRLEFGDAVEFYKTKHGHLASISSLAEQNAVTDLIRTTPRSYTYTWIGYIDTKATNLDWNWVDGMGGYTNWGSRSPHADFTFVLAISSKQPSTYSVNSTQK